MEETYEEVRLALGPLAPGRACQLPPRLLSKLVCRQHQSVFSGGPPGALFLWGPAPRCTLPVWGPAGVRLPQARGRAGGRGSSLQGRLSLGPAHPRLPHIPLWNIPRHQGLPRGPAGAPPQAAESTVGRASQPPSLLFPLTALCPSLARHLSLFFEQQALLAPACCLEPCARGWAGLVLTLSSHSPLCASRRTRCSCPGRTARARRASQRHPGPCRGADKGSSARTRPTTRSTSRSPSCPSPRPWWPSCRGHRQTMRAQWGLGAGTMAPTCPGLRERRRRRRRRKTKLRRKRRGRRRQQQRRRRRWPLRPLSRWVWPHTPARIQVARPPGAHRQGSQAALEAPGTGGACPQRPTLLCRLGADSVASSLLAL